MRHDINTTTNFVGYVLKPGSLFTYREGKGWSYSIETVGDYGFYLSGHTRLRKDAVAKLKSHIDELIKELESIQKAIK